MSQRNCKKCGHPLIEHRKPPAPFSRKYYECRYPGCKVREPYYGIEGPCHISGKDFKE